ncbi:MAG: BrnT family toxin [Pseudomonadota bacterium]|nr:BrnT family toxin [Pseudomonadota bacterium]
MLFEWDTEKARSNLEKHGVSFDLVTNVRWSDGQAVEDRRIDYGERRLLVQLGIEGRLYIVVYTTRDDRRRLISLRKANAREVARYEHEQKKYRGP